VELSVIEIYDHYIEQFILCDSHNSIVFFYIKNRLGGDEMARVQSRFTARSDWM